VNCPNCRCMLYIEEDVLAASPATKKKNKEVATKA
jgi:hypothetical protein